MKNILSNLLRRQTRHCQTNPCKMCYETVDTMLHFVMRMLPSNDFKDGLMLSVFFLSKNKCRPCDNNYTLFRLNRKATEYKTNLAFSSVFLQGTVLMRPK